MQNYSDDYYSDNYTDYIEGNNNFRTATANSLIVNIKNPPWCTRTKQLLCSNYSKTVQDWG
jgi:hypothetical protein